MRIHPLLVLSSAAVLATALPASAQNITILTAPVGNVGNPEVPKGQAPDGCPGCGTVDYQFDIGVHEVTNAQYAAFLNAVAATDTYSLYDPAMAGGQGGIVRSGAPGSYVYTTVSGRENWPVVFVTFWDAARFANWLENGQGNGSTETGTYLLNGVTNPKSPVTRGLGSWVIPSRNEWVKAAYYSGSGSVYSGYPTQSDSIKPGMANYFSGDGGTVSLVPVGSYAYPSHYGTYDQGGNANEWTDTSEGSGDPMQYALGGSFEVPAEQLAIDQQSGDQFSNTGLASTGFRVAKVIPPLPPIAILTTPVGDPCNPGWEQDNGAGFPELCGGGVPYLYAIGVYEVTNAQYAAFLNAVAATDTYSLYNPAMAGSLGGIVQLGVSGGYSYWPVSGRENWPVNYVSFWDAARFVNWLENGQGSGGTETGTYTLNGVTNPTNQPTRNAGSTWAVASTNEWIKAAYGQGYFDGTGEGCCGATTEKCSDYGYVRYATQTPDLEPSACNIAASAIDAPRPVGSYPYASHYGTYDQDGNVSEITETWDDFLGPDQMTAIGGGYDTDDVEIGLCDNTFESFPTSESADLGFRIVEITGTGGCNDADFDNNGIVDAADLGSLISAWGPCGTTSCVADINRDGQVDGVDIGHMLGFWGPCPN